MWGLNPRDEARRKIVYIDEQLASDRPRDEKNSFHKLRAEILERCPEAAPKKVNPFIVRAAKTNPMVAKLLAQGKIG